MRENFRFVCVCLALTVILALTKSSMGRPSNISHWLSCEIPNDKLFGKTPLPWVATLGFHEEQDEFYLPGTILDEWTVITCKNCTTQLPLLPNLTNALYAVHDISNRYGLHFIQGDGKLKLLPRENYTVYIGNNGASDVIDAIAYNVSYIKPHPKLQRVGLWMQYRNDFVLVFLQTPILPFTTMTQSNNSVTRLTQVQRACLPDSTNVEAARSHRESDVVIGGWTKEDFIQISLKLDLKSPQYCLEKWIEKFGPSSYDEYPYVNLECGYPMGTTEDNPNASCTGRDSGVLAKMKDDRKAYYLGFVRNYYRDNETKTCNEKALFFVASSSSKHIGI